MDLIQSLKASGTALAAHRTKMNIIAENLANVETTRTEEGGPYRRKMVVFTAKPLDEIKGSMAEGERERFREVMKEEEEKYTGVEVTDIVQSQEDFRLVYNPAHPDADPVTGYVAMPNVDHMTEMADMIVARRAYDASVTAMTTTKEMILKALEIGK